MNGLELIKTNDGEWYWRMDYRHSDNGGGTYILSINYKSDLDAIYYLCNNGITWEIKDTHRDKS